MGRFAAEISKGLILNGLQTLLYGIELIKIDFKREVDLYKGCGRGRKYNLIFGVASN